MLSMTEIIAIGVIALVVVGPEKFPGLAKLAIRTMRDLRGHIDDLKREVNQELNPLKGKMNELRRIDPEKYIDSLMEEEEAEKEKPVQKDPNLAKQTPDYEMDYESDSYWENDEYGIHPRGGVEGAVSKDAEARDEAELTEAGQPAPAAESSVARQEATAADGAAEAPQLSTEQADNAAGTSTESNESLDSRERITD